MQRRPYRMSFSPRKRFGGPTRTNKFDISKYINKAIPETQQTEYTPKYKFEQFELDKLLLENILRKGFESPMPIQDQSIPHLIEGKDLIGIANTGMGKTAAFLIPLINKTVKDRSNKTLIITPTRELADQIRVELYELTRGLGIYSVLIIGGASMRKQMYELGRQHHFIIGTPGRLRDLQARNMIKFSQFKNVVLDEVDRMFDMGFSKDVGFMLNLLPKERQSLFFSATINPQVERLINLNSKSPITVSVKKRETTTSVDQDVVRIGNNQNKMEVLHDLLIKEDFKKILIFGRTKFGVNRLALELTKRGFKAESIHGDKSQSQRQRALMLFKQDRVNILVATDVAARGLDIPNVSHVINYEVPENYSDYIHRIGRTGRANQTGKALTFV